MSKRIQSTVLAAACVFCLAGTVAFSQTLTVVEPSSHSESAPLTSIRGGTAPVSGPTEIPHHPLPLQANYRNSAGKGADPGSTLDAAAAPDPVARDAVRADLPPTR